MFVEFQNDAEYKAHVTKMRREDIVEGGGALSRAPKGSRRLPRRSRAKMWRDTRSLTAPLTAAPRARPADDYGYADNGEDFADDDEYDEDEEEEGAAGADGAGAGAGASSSSSAAAARKIAPSALLARGVGSGGPAVTLMSSSAAEVVHERKVGGKGKHAAAAAAAGGA
jgi:hypothetical protein